VGNIAVVIVADEIVHQTHVIWFAVHYVICHLTCHQVVLSYVENLAAILHLLFL